MRTEIPASEPHDDIEIVSRSGESSISAPEAGLISAAAAARTRFGLGDSALGAWRIPLSSLGGRDNRFAWWRVLEVFPPVRSAPRTGTGKYRSREEGDAWEAALDGIVDSLEAAGFTVPDYYTLCLTLERLTEDQWARVDKRLFIGEGIHTRAGWMIAPISERWAEWPRLVHEKGMLPHEATEHILGGVWLKNL